LANADLTCATGSRPVLESSRLVELRRAILDKNVRIPQDATVGYDLDADRARGWHVTDSGIVVIGREFSTVPVAAMFA